MSQKLMIEFYIPITKDGPGERYSEDLWEVQNTILERFGGFTAYEAGGCWKDPNGKLVWDRIMVYRCLIDAMADTEVRELTEKFRELLGQDELWATCDPTYLIIGDGWKTCELDGDPDADYGDTFRC